MIALCADLGVKTVGYCDTKAKKPIKSCAEMGIKTPGFCYVDTKQPVPGIKKSTNTIKEQTTPKVDPQKLNYVISAWGGPKAVTVKQSGVGTTVTNNKTKSVITFDLNKRLVHYDKSASIDVMPYAIDSSFEAFKKWFDSHNNYNPLSGFTNRTYIDEQLPQAAVSGLKQAMATKPQGGQVPFNPTHIGGYEIDCKSRQVKLNTKGVVLKPEASASLVDIFCNPKYRATSTPSPVAKQTAPILR
jgi:hypothetical protein